jgi:general L-amino acid transport system permease protein
MTDIQAPSDRELLIFKPKPSQPPPPATTGLIGWLRMNLFSSVSNTLLTVIGFYLIYLVASAVNHWGIELAVWNADTRRECLDQSPYGACWAGVFVWFNRFIYGRYPDLEQWRVSLTWVIFAAWMAPVWFPRVTSKVAIGLSAILIYPFLAGYFYLGGERNWFMEIMVSVAILSFVLCWAHVLLCLITGRGLGTTIISLSGYAGKHDKTHKYPIIAFGAVGFVIVYALISGWTLKEIGTNNWGGLFLTLVISGIGIAFALPAGIVLALGRRSKMPVIRVVCVAFIELLRSVPLITVLFMATTMFPLFLPEGLVFNKLASAIVAVCLFSAAYMAETVRGGLQAINKGQYEAAAAIGLGYWPMMALIIMPQALKLMIPNIVGSFIGLFKDTTLVSIIGLYDMLGMIKAVSQNPQWIGLHHEPLVTAAMIFFIGCFAMSKYSRHLEKKLGQGDRR